jgi:glycosyltransferase involved in cell wall biosynthesis
LLVPQSKRIVLFMSFPRSLKWWEESGIKDRELALFRCLVRHGYAVTILSYGDNSEAELLSQDDKGIEVICNRWRLPNRLYSFLIPIVFRDQLRRADFFRTNQISGAYAAIWARLWYRKILIVRQGYSLAEFWARDSLLRRVFTPLCHLYEQAIQRAGNSLIVTTDEMRRYAVTRAGCCPNNVHVIPNYVADNFFSYPVPRRSLQHHERVNAGFIGRLVEQKNLQALVEACSGLPINLELIGDGSQRAILQKLAQEHGVTLSLRGTLPNEELAEALGSWDLFVFPSLYEGLPKALIEAMASGIPIIAAKSPGVHTMFDGCAADILVEPSVTGLRDGLKRFLSMGADERHKIGRAMQNRATELYSLIEVIKREEAVYTLTLDQNRH